jgi:cellulose synthase operon protein C
MGLHRNLNFWLTSMLYIALLQVGCSRDPNVRKLNFLHKGDSYFQKAEYREALITYSRAIQIDPDFAEAYYKAAQCQLHLSNWQGAFEALTRTVKLQPNNWPAQLDLAKLLLKGGGAVQARDIALLIRQNNPGDVDVLMLLSNAYGQLGDQTNSLVAAQGAVEKAPARADAYTNLGILQERAGLFVQAKSSLQRAHELNPAALDPVMALGKTYERQKQWTDAQKQYEAAMSIEPKSIAPRIALASFWKNRGQLDLAKKVLEQTKAELPTDPAAYRLLGDYYISLNQRERALVEFQELNAVHPNDLAVKKTLAQLLLDAHRQPEAKKIVQNILESSPQDPDALLLKAQSQLQEQAWDDAISTLQQLVQKAPENAAAHFYLGSALEGKGYHLLAAQELHKSVELQPTNLQGWRALAAVAQHNSDWSALESVGTQLKNTQPMVPEGYLYHGIARMNEGDTSGAELDLKTVMQMAPDNALSYSALAQLRVSQRRWNDAETLYKQALQRDPNSLVAIRGIAEVSLAENKPGDAQAFVAQQIARNSNSPELYLLQGEIFLRLKQPEPAAAALSRALELDPKNVSSLAYLGEAHDALNQRDKAIENYKKAIAISPRTVALYLALGSIYERGADWQQARDNYQKAHDLEPDNPLAANNLAYILLEHGGDPNVALSLAQIARKGFPNLPNSADTLGWAYYRIGAYSTAAPLLESAVKGKPENQIYHLHLGLTYQKVNDKTRAKAELEKALSIDPNSEIAKQARQALAAS